MLGPFTRPRRLPLKANRPIVTAALDRLRTHQARKAYGMYSFLAGRSLGGLFIQRLAGLGAYFQYSCHLVQQCLILDGLSALQGLDIVGLSIDFLGEFGLCHLVRVFRATVTDGGADFRIDFLDRDDVIGAVDFGKTLAFDTGFAGLWVGQKTYFNLVARDT